MYQKKKEYKAYVKKNKENKAYVKKKKEEKCKQIKESMLLLKKHPIKTLQSGSSFQ